MSTIVSEYNPSFKERQINAGESKKAAFTCLACQVAFPTSERQRSHYRTDWHKYNLKRKIANLSSVSAEQFTQKVLAQQAQGREEQEKQGLIYECLICRKSYLSENAYNNHISSKKHLELEHKADLEEQKRKENENNNVADSKDDSVSLNKTHSIDPILDCLFCTQRSEDLGSNLSHMTQKHSFFIPDIEYLQDQEGLIKYLSEKINVEYLCIYCNGRGRELHSAAAARAHMLDRGHCKMAYDESEDPEQLLKYYDFDNDLLEEDIQENKQNTDELVLENGTKLGHRKFLQSFKKNQARKATVPEPTETQEQPEQPESLRRKERRHLITDGKEQDMKRTADGIREIAKQQEFSRHLAFKQNMNQTLRARIQNPI